MISLRLLVVAVMTAHGQMVWAQTAEPEKAGSTETKTASPISTSTSLGSDSIFSQSISPSELSLTPNYASSRRRDAQPGMMTARAHGAPITFDGVYVYPTAILTLGHDDNLISSTINEISSTFASLRPDIVVEEKNHGDRYTASYQGNYTHYADSYDDDFDHHEFQVAGDNTFSSRARLGWLVGYAIDTDPRGSTDRGISELPDKWHAPTAAALFAYGAQGAIGRIEVETSLQNKRYVNNRNTTVAADVDLYNVAGRFFYRIAPATSLLIEARQIKSDYMLSISPNSNTDRRLLVGVTWEATAATTGVFKIGRLKKSFIDSIHSDYSGITWEGSVRWAPLTYSTVTITTSRAPFDSSGVGDYILNRTMSIAWNHQWTKLVTSHVNLGATNSDYRGVDRQDDTRNYGIGLSYGLRRWLKIGAELARTQRSSNQPGIPFDRDIVLLTLEGTL